MKVFAVRHRTTRRGELAQILCVVFRSAVAGLLECVRVLASLFGERAPWSKSDAKTPRTPNSESFREAAYFPRTGGQAVRNAMDTFCPVHALRIVPISSSHMLLGGATGGGSSNYTGRNASAVRTLKTDRLNRSTTVRLSSRWQSQCLHECWIDLGTDPRVIR